MLFIIFNYKNGKKNIYMLGVMVGISYGNRNCKYGMRVEWSYLVWLEAKIE